MMLRLITASAASGCAHCLTPDGQGHASNCPFSPTCPHCWRQEVQTTDGRTLLIHAAKCPGSSWVCPSAGCDKRVVTGAETCPGCDGQRPCDVIVGCVLPFRHRGFCDRTVPPTT